MRKIHALIFLLLISYSFSAEAQEIQWYWSSEISPTSRMAKDRVLDPNMSNFNIEWRNRIGIEVGNQLFLGLQGHIRNYNNEEIMVYEYTQASHVSSTYEFNHENMLWGIGSFLAKSFQLNDRFSLQPVLFASVENGKGTYTIDLTGFHCLGCSAEYFTSVPTPYEIARQRFRERNFFTGFEIGGVYKLTTKISALLSVNLFQYENFRFSPTDNQVPTELEPHLERNLYHSGKGFTHIFDRPIGYLGVQVALN